MRKEGASQALWCGLIRQEGMDLAKIVISGSKGGGRADYSAKETEGAVLTVSHHSQARESYRRVRHPDRTE